ncbi:hypothetical protein D3C87_1504210 [compost metagenome]
MYHLGAHLFYGYLWHPTQLGLGLGRVAEQGFNLGWAEETLIDFNDHIAHFHAGGVIAADSADGGDFIHPFAAKSQFDASFFSRHAHKFTHRDLLAGSDHEIFSGILLQHHPLHTHVIFGVAPVAQRIHIAQMQAAFETLSDIGDSAGDLAGDKGFTTAWRFMVKQNAVTGIHAIGFAVVHGDPVGIHLGHRIG